MTTPSDLDGRVLGIIKKAPGCSVREVTWSLNSSTGGGYEFEQVANIVIRLINEGKVERGTEHDDALYAIV